MAIAQLRSLLRFHCYPVDRHSYPGHNILPLRSYGNCVETFKLYKLTGEKFVWMLEDQWFYRFFSQRIHKPALIYKITKLISHAIHFTDLPFLQFIINWLLDHILSPLRENILVKSLLDFQINASMPIYFCIRLALWSKMLLAQPHTRPFVLY